MILKKHTVTALKEGSSLSSKLGLCHPLLSTSNKNNINSSYTDGCSDVDFLKPESGLILLIN